MKTTPCAPMNQPGARASYRACARARRSRPRHIVVTGSGGARLGDRQPRLLMDAGNQTGRSAIRGRRRGSTSSGCTRPRRPYDRDRVGIKTGGRFSIGKGTQAASTLIVTHTVSPVMKLAHQNTGPTGRSVGVVEALLGAVSGTGRRTVIWRDDGHEAPVSHGAEEHSQSRERA